MSVKHVIINNDNVSFKLNGLTIPKHYALDEDSLNQMQVHITNINDRSDYLFCPCLLKDISIDGSSFATKKELSEALSGVTYFEKNSTNEVVRQNLLIHFPRITGEPNNTSFRAVSSVAGFGGDAMVNVTDSVALTSSIQPKAGYIVQDGLKLKSGFVTVSLKNWIQNAVLKIYAKELDTNSSSNPAILISTQLIAEIPMLNFPQRGNLFMFSVNSEYSLKENMAIEVYIAGVAENTESLDLRSFDVNLKFE